MQHWRPNILEMEALCLHRHPKYLDWYEVCGNASLWSMESLVAGLIGSSPARAKSCSGWVSQPEGRGEGQT
jgi:hypothetical protein